MSRQEMDDPSTLRRVLDAMLLIEADLDLPVLLRHVIEEACAMTGARYGGLGVLDESRTRLAEFITVGLEADQEEEIGTRAGGPGSAGDQPRAAPPFPALCARGELRVPRRPPPHDVVPRCPDQGA